MNTNTLAVLDYEKEVVHLYNIAPGLEVDDDYISRLGFDPECCSWMFGTFVDVVKHKGTLL